MGDLWMTVKVHPNAGKDVLVSLSPGRFEAWVKTKLMEGRANEAVVNLLVRNLQVARDQVRLVKGHHGRVKVFKVTGSVRK